LAEPETGIPRLPYFHQAEALELFLNEDRDLIVATGTGSGKTETFLMPVVGKFAIEASTQPASWKRSGVRALILYPMNALVNDQVARLRKLMGNQTVAASLRGSRARNVTFGMYTGRTPYAGQPTKAKNKKRLREALENLYINGVTPEIKALLQKEGKWPAKDIPAFIASDYTTGSDDSELLTRHEMQASAPDILVTNYSMLEYMMLRPIEASIFQQTRSWLEADPENSFTVILDEAHMYRGSAGAEVAYLLRRLHARLGISRDRVRYILTSASFGTGKEAEEQALEFARKLTGGEGKGGFSLIAGKHEERPVGNTANEQLTQALSEVDPASFQRSPQDLVELRATLSKLNKALGHTSATETDSLGGIQAAFYEALWRLPVAHLISKEMTARPRTLSDLVDIGFPGRGRGEAAIEALLAIMAFSRQAGTGRPFASLRSHLFFRGVQGIYACSNRACSNALGAYSDRLLGSLHDRPLFQCSCGARVYELLTHRDCGAAYFRGYVTKNDDFLCHEPSKRVWSDLSLTEVQAFVLREEDVSSADGYIRWLHTPTGRVVGSAPARSRSGEFLPLIWGTREISERGSIKRVVEPECPSCKETFSSDPKIMDLATKGEAPFSHLIKAQVALQPPSLPVSPRSPNAGRKSLLFSDGRQKAARLARDIPREIELDVFRQLLFLAVDRLKTSGKEPILDSRIYIGFLDAVTDSSVSLFDGLDRDKLRSHVAEFSDFFGGNLDDALAAFEPPSAFNVSLLRQLCSSFYSVSALTLGRIMPSSRASRMLTRQLPDIDGKHLSNIAEAWILRLLSKYAFDGNLAKGVRRKAWPYNVHVASPLDGFSVKQRKFLQSLGFNPETVAHALSTVLCDPRTEDGLMLSPSKLKLEPAFSDSWIQCDNCKKVLPVDWWERCFHCLSESVQRVIAGESGYLRARKGFWHDPVVAVVEGRSKPLNLSVEEHTAQLSYKDAGGSDTTTEEFERRFRDILIHKHDVSIDVLSSTTTMEVGIDIGSLVAVGMRNVPPMRQNYQQRAGRAGRRGASISSVVTFAQNGPHDGYYFSNPAAIISGNPPKPILDTRNENIVTRHVRAQLLQDFFGPRATVEQSGDLSSVLGSTASFYDSESEVSLKALRTWLTSSVEATQSLARARSWMPSELAGTVESVADEFVEVLEACRPQSYEVVEEGLLDYMFAKGLLPSYAFPRDLCALHIERWNPKANPPIVIDERPQQSLNVALSEYAPGKQLVVNKKTYRVGTVAANSPFTEANRARHLFESSKRYVHCTECLYTAGFASKPFEADATKCPQCGNEALSCSTVITPEVVYPVGGREVDEYNDEHTYSRASSAQLPLPDTTRPLNLLQFGINGSLVFERSQDLVMVNRGPGNEDGSSGFVVCKDCGKVLLDGEPPGAHERDYRVQQSSGSPLSRKCSGEFETVYLGYGFVSDVLILRVELKSPLRFDLIEGRNRRPLEDALASLADALVLAMSRVMDIDAREINAGHRFAVNGEKTYADIFMYDTLSGGAGYAYQAGSSFAEIFSSAVSILENCSCDSSCESCLRHYGNRFNHGLLDRFLALDLARYIELGVSPTSVLPDEQRATLGPLAELLTLAGWKVTFQEDGGFAGTLGTRSICIEAVPSLTMPPVSGASRPTVYFSRYELTRDLSSAYAEIA
jgi:ATP-dependent helicase YprA (DUF1998 family)/Zn finger protein HypA/HybF involved in hydrogenase expression